MQQKRSSTRPETRPFEATPHFPFKGVEYFGNGRRAVSLKFPPSWGPKYRVFFTGEGDGGTRVSKFLPLVEADAMARRFILTGKPELEDGEP